MQVLWSVAPPPTKTMTPTWGEVRRKSKQIETEPPGSHTTIPIMDVGWSQLEATDCPLPTGNIMNPVPDQEQVEVTLVACVEEVSVVTDIITGPSGLT